MPDGVGLLNLITSPLLERVAREERLGKDHPRKPRDQNANPPNEDEKDSSPADEAQKVEAPVSSKHIDLRI